MGYIRVPHFDFRRGNATDFLLSPVSTPDAVLDDLSILWELNQESSAGNAKKVVERPSV
jgi:hypothetical protein